VALRVVCVVAVRVQARSGTAICPARRWMVRAHGQIDGNAAVLLLLAFSLQHRMLATNTIAYMPCLVRVLQAAHS
jgi:hypothetical protein